jgi:osmotically-inducible protein OsmY
MTSCPTVVLVDGGSVTIQGEVVVRPEEKGELRERAVHVSDDVLATAIREERAEDIRVDASEIEARASDGEVTPEGSVTDLAQKRIAEQDARDVVGVAWVTNDLFVKTGQREDRTIRDDVDFDLETDSARAPFDLESSVEDGVATLTGDLDTWDDSRAFRFRSSLPRPSASTPQMDRLDAEAVRRLTDARHSKAEAGRSS